MFTQDCLLIQTWYKTFFVKKNRVQIVLADSFPSKYTFFYFTFFSFWDLVVKIDYIKHFCVCFFFALYIYWWKGPFKYVKPVEFNLMSRRDSGMKWYLNTLYFDWNLWTMNHINMAHVQGNVDLHNWFYCSEVSIYQLFLHFKCHLNDLILNCIYGISYLFYILMNSNLKINLVVCQVSTNYVMEFV